MNTTRSSNTLSDIRALGDLLSHIDAGIDIEPNTLAQIGYMIQRKADEAIALVPDEWPQHPEPGDRLDGTDLIQASDKRLTFILDGLNYKGVTDDDARTLAAAIDHASTLAAAMNSSCDDFQEDE